LSTAPPSLQSLRIDRSPPPASSGPGAGRIALIRHAGERINVPMMLPARCTGDPERYWELCDLNLVRYPQELTAEPGAVVRLPGGGAGQTTGFFPI
jgi:hypothetical protein